MARMKELRDRLVNQQVDTRGGRNRLIRLRGKPKVFEWTIGPSSPVAC